jgi:hypothetical protein
MFNFMIICRTRQHVGGVGAVQILAAHVATAALQGVIRQPAHVDTEGM